MIAKRCKFNNQTVLVLFDDENQPWFRLNDVSAALGYNTNSRRQVQFLRSTNNLKQFKDFPHPKVQDVKLDYRTNFVNEPGVCSLLVRSLTPEAKELIMRLLPKMYHTCSDIENLPSS